MNIKAIYIEPRKEAEVVSLDDTSYQTLKGYIIGMLHYLEVSERPGLCIIYDEEYLLKDDLKFNRRYQQYPFKGPMLFLRQDPSTHDFVSLTDDDAAWIMARFKEVPDESQGLADGEIESILADGISITLKKGDWYGEKEDCMPLSVSIPLKEAYSDEGLYSVGRVYDKWKTHQVRIQIYFDDFVWYLAVGYPSITGEEIENLHRGALQMAFTVISGSLFFLCKAGEIPWFDAPYEPRLLDEPLKYQEIKEAGQGAPLVILISDTDTGCLKAIRMVGMGHLFTNRLHRTCEKLDKERPLAREQYNKHVQRIYERYPTSESMLKTVKPTDLFAIIKE